MTLKTSSPLVLVAPWLITTIALVFALWQHSERASTKQEAAFKLTAFRRAQEMVLPRDETLDSGHVTRSQDIQTSLLDAVESRGIAQDMDLEAYLEKKEIGQTTLTSFSMEHSQNEKDKEGHQSDFERGGWMGLHNMSIDPRILAWECPIVVRGGACSPCSAGTVPNVERSGACEVCGAGTFLSTWSIYIKGKAVLLVECERCPAGEVAPSGSTACTPCNYFFEPSQQGDECRFNTKKHPWIEHIYHGCIMLVLLSIFTTVSYYSFVLWRQRMTRLLIETVLKDFKHAWRKDERKMKDLLKKGQRAKLRALVSELQREVNILETKYLDLEYITKILGEENMKLIRGGWLANGRDTRFKRQQDLPPEAIWSPMDFERELPMITVVVVSYCWLHEAHPDPAGQYIKLLKRALTLRLAQKGEGQILGIAMFFDFMSMAQHEETGGFNPVQTIKRTPKEATSFGAAMAEVNVLYANQMTQTWILQWVPEGIARSYDERAWPTFEKAASSLIKDPQQLITLTDKLFGYKTWADAFVHRPHRTPPLVPYAFDIRIDTKSVTSGKDKDFLKMKYEETFRDVVGKATRLWFGDMDWDQNEAWELALMLRFCDRLELLILKGNRFSADSALAIIKASASVPTLEIIDFSNNAIGTHEHDRIIRCWMEAGKRLDQLVLSLGEFGEHRGSILSASPIVLPIGPDPEWIGQVRVLSDEMEAIYDTPTDSKSADTTQENLEKASNMTDAEFTCPECGHTFLQETPEDSRLRNTTASLNSTFVESRGAERLAKGSDDTESSKRNGVQGSDTGGLAEIGSETTGKGDGKIGKARSQKQDRQRGASAQNAKGGLAEMGSETTGKGVGKMGSARSEKQGRQQGAAPTNEEGGLVEMGSETTGKGVGKMGPARSEKQGKQRGAAPTNEEGGLVEMGSETTGKRAVKVVSVGKMGTARSQRQGRQRADALAENRKRLQAEGLLP